MPRLNLVDHMFRGEQMLTNDRNPRHSAYVGDADDWRRFLSCWYRDYATRRSSTYETSLVKRDVLEVRPAASDVALRRELAVHEVRLGLRLPRSYVDFMVAYAPDERRLQDWNFLHVSAIDRIDAVAPGWTTSAMQHVEDESDERYFTYGTEQVDTTRTRYLPTAVALGRHDMGTPFLIVLHPEVLTVDGEMETEIFFHAGSLRAPSFAEMMRFLYYYQVRLGPGVPTYSQAAARGTCADLLPMKAVWWR